MANCMLFPNAIGQLLHMTDRIGSFHVHKSKNQLNLLMPHIYCWCNGTIEYFEYFAYLHFANPRRNLAKRDAVGISVELCWSSHGALFVDVAMQAAAAAASTAITVGC